MPTEPVPSICVLDPDGNIVRRIKNAHGTKKHAGWACYHSELYVIEWCGLQLGLVGCAVGASFAVLVAEQLFASGCGLLISITSSGQLNAVSKPPYFILIDRALRDEGTSYHYLPASRYSPLETSLRDALRGAFNHLPEPVICGGTWTTDAPYRETADRIDLMRSEGLFAVEMEAAALYAFAQARRKRVICFAHVTNQMGQAEGDFKKGEQDGTNVALDIVAATARCLSAPMELQDTTT